MKCCAWRLRAFPTEGAGTVHMSSVCGVTQTLLRPAILGPEELRVNNLSDERDSEGSQVSKEQKAMVNDGSIV